MSYKSQLFSLSSTGEMSERLPVQSFWGDPPASADFQGTNLLRSWIVYDSKSESDATLDRGQGSIIFGLAIAFGFSAIAWIGMAVVIARVWK